MIDTLRILRLNYLSISVIHRSQMTSISKQVATDILQKLIDTISNLEKLKAGCDEYLRWRRDVETALLKIFPDDDRHLKDFKGILFSDPGPMFAVAGPNTRS